MNIDSIIPFLFANGIQYLRKVNVKKKENIDNARTTANIIYKYFNLFINILSRCMGEKKKIIIIVGTRSEVIKFSSIIRELRKNKNFDVKILHTGQHDTIKLMKSLNLPNPDFYLGESLRKKWSKKSKIFSIILAIFWAIKTFFKIRKILIQEKPDAVFYQGNCMSVPITVFAAKSISRKIILIHRESGMRMKMGGELESILAVLFEKIGDLGDILFAPTPLAKNNLIKEKVRGKIFLTGDPQVEIVNYASKISKKKINGEYVIAYIARSIENKKKIKNLLKILFSSPYKVVFVMNPNVKYKLKSYGFFDALKNAKNIILLDSLEYPEFLSLLKNSKALLTDRSGPQQESFILKIPCIFLGEDNFWKEFENIGVVKSTKFDVNKTLKLIQEIKNRGEFYRKVKKSKYPFGDGKATKKIISILEKELS
ncbi:MAG: UDP-N-acetylglucosamine 2-epimerase [Candidatus Micrarchaeia archaeon]